MADEDVFTPVGQLPHHDDHPFTRHMHRDAHTERHRNTGDYVAHHHSPNTNRKNAGILLRRLSDDFNVRKFPDLLKEVERKRCKSEGSVVVDAKTGEAGVHYRVYRFVRTLSSTALPSTDTAPSKPPTLPESPDEETSQ